MNIALWVIQSLLAGAFGFAGGTKLAKDRTALLADKGMGWAADFSAQQIKLIGFAEVLGAIGLILPQALGVLPDLTLVAAGALALLMGGAAMTHRRRNEPAAVPVVLALLSATVVAGRFVVG